MRTKCISVLRQLWKLSSFVGENFSVLCAATLASSIAWPAMAENPPKSAWSAVPELAATSTFQRPAPLPEDVAKQLANDETSISEALNDLGMISAAIPKAEYALQVRTE